MATIGTSTAAVRTYIGELQTWLDRLTIIVDADKTRTDCDVDQMSAALRDLIDTLTEEEAPLALVCAGVLGALAAGLEMDTMTATMFSVFGVALGNLADGVSLNEMPAL